MFGYKGLHPEILTLNWQHATSGPQGFETAARTLRYRALGDACISLGTRALFLGHHNDDNVETALVRLSEGHSRSGLAGFDELGAIPENSGRHGIWKSGSRMSFRSMYRHGSIIVEDSSRAAAAEKSLPYQLDLQPFIATGGVHLCRPFRTISKSRLLATCHDAGLPFVTDPTNLDPTLTDRNAVRHLLASGDLPQALQPDSLSDLVQSTREAKIEDFRRSDAFAQSCKILSFDLRSGCAVVQFPSSQQLDSIRVTTETGASRSTGSLLGTQALTMRRFNDIVCARQSTDGDTFASAAPAVFPRRDHHLSPGSPTPPPKTFTLGSVLWTPVKQSSGRETKNLHPGDFTQRSQPLVPENLEPNIWLLSRRLQPKTSVRPVVDFQLKIPAFSSRDANVASKWTDWQLWDERYWISIQITREVENDGNAATDACEAEYFPATTVPITMRPLEEGDITTITEQLEHGQTEIHVPPTTAITNPSTGWVNHTMFKRLLHAIAPGNIRFTLPVLCGTEYISTLPTQTQTEAQASGGGEIYGLPSIYARTTRRICVHHPSPSQTFGSASPYPATSTEFKEQKNGVIQSQQQQHQGPVSYWNLNWRIEYKHVDPDLVRLTGYKAPIDGCEEPAYID